ncbi:MAG TPA: hypothetical protein VM183_13160 [Burkholderiales bacterium]|nr:hypothetical protein [Burkholderiales bacterium]
MAATIYSRALQKAAELVGGRDELAKALQVPAAEIEKWIADQSKPPRDIFLRVVDIILDETAAGAADDAPEAPPGRDAAGPTRYVD